MNVNFEQFMSYLKTFNL